MSMFCLNVIQSLQLYLVRIFLSLGFVPSASFYSVFQAEPMHVHSLQRESFLMNCFATFSSEAAGITYALRKL